MFSWTKFHSFSLSLFWMYFEYGRNMSCPSTTLFSSDSDTHYLRIFGFIWFDFAFTVFFRHIRCVQLPTCENTSVCSYTPVSKLTYVCVYVCLCVCSNLSSVAIFCQLVHEHSITITAGSKRKPLFCDIFKQVILNVSCTIK